MIGTSHFISPDEARIAAGSQKVVGTGFYRDAAPGSFGPSEWLDLLMACQDGRATCLRVMEYIDRETVPARLQSQKVDELIEKMTNAFLAWPLPQSVCADRCASMMGYAGRSGTNLMTYTEAKEMFRAVVAPLISSDSTQNIDSGDSDSK